MPKSPTRESANHLRAWRELRGMSQEELAAKANTKGNVISQLESGERGLSAKWLRVLAPLLGTTPGFMLDHDPRDLDSVYLQETNSVPQEKRKQVIELIRVIKNG